MENLTMCGYCCELCKAYAPNIKKLDQKEILSEYPCHTFSEREGLSCQSANENPGFSQKEYDEFLLAYDNKTRLDEFKRSK